MISKYEKNSETHYISLELGDLKEKDKIEHILDLKFIPDVMVIGYVSYHCPIYESPKSAYLYSSLIDPDIPLLSIEKGMKNEKHPINYYRRNIFFWVRDENGNEIKDMGGTLTMFVNFLEYY